MKRIDNDCKVIAIQHDKLLYELMNWSLAKREEISRVLHEFGLVVKSSYTTDKIFKDTGYYIINDDVEAGDNNPWFCLVGLLDALYSNEENGSVTEILLFSLEEYTDYAPGFINRDKICKKFNVEI